MAWPTDGQSLEAFLSGLSYKLLEGHADARDDNMQLDASYREVTEGETSSPIAPQTSAEATLGAGGNMTPSWLSTSYELLSWRTFLVDLSDDCLHRVLLFSQQGRTFPSFAGVCRAIRVLVTKECCLSLSKVVLFLALQVCAVRFECS